MKRRIFVTGNGTDVGKTVISAILTETLEADYWKPIQAGSLDFTDSDVIRSLISNTRSRVHPEAVRLQAPLSPHAAAALENKYLKITDIAPPHTENILVIEGAGGILVPISGEELMIDLALNLEATALIVSRHYLGSINHTLLTAEALTRRKIPVLGVLFNGDSNPQSESAIIEHSGLEHLGRINFEKEITKTFVNSEARKLRQVREIIACLTE